MTHFKQTENTYVPVKQFMNFQKHIKNVVFDKKNNVFKKKYQYLIH